MLVRSRHAVINENEPNRPWKSAGRQSQIGTHVPHPSVRSYGRQRVLSDAYFRDWCAEIDWTRVARDSSQVLCAKPKFRVVGERLGLAKRGAALQQKRGTSSSNVNKCVGSGAVRFIRYQLELVGHSAELGKGTSLHLLHRLAAMHGLNKSLTAPARTAGYCRRPYVEIVAGLNR
jgi:hypothetical protein